MNQEINQIVKRYKHCVHIDDKEGRARIKQLAITRPELQRLIAEIDIIHEAESDFDSNWNSFKELSSSDKITALLFSISLLSFLRLVFNFANPPAIVVILQNNLELLGEDSHRALDNFGAIGPWIAGLMYALYLTAAWYSFASTFVKVEDSNYQINWLQEILKTAVLTSIILFIIEKLGLLMLT